MGKVDKLKTAKLHRDKHEWFADKMPSKKTKRAKASERQQGRKEIRKEQAK